MPTSEPRARLGLAGHESRAHESRAGQRAGPRGDRPDGGLRTLHHRSRRLAVRPARRDRGHRRPERQREVDAAQGRDRHAAPGVGDGPAARQAVPRTSRESRPSGLSASAWPTSRSWPTSSRPCRWPRTSWPGCASARPCAAGAWTWSTRCSPTCGLPRAGQPGQEVLGHRQGREDVGQLRDVGHAEADDPLGGFPVTSCGRPASSRTRPRHRAQRVVAPLSSVDFPLPFGPTDDRDLAAPDGQRGVANDDGASVAHRQAGHLEDRLAGPALAPVTHWIRDPPAAEREAPM